MKGKFDDSTNSNTRNIRKNPPINLRSTPYYFGDRFLSENYPLIMDGDAVASNCYFSPHLMRTERRHAVSNIDLIFLELKRAPNPLFSIQYPMSHEFWYELYKTAIVSNCDEVQQFIEHKFFNNQDRIDAFNFFLQAIRFNCENGRKEKIAHLFTTFPISVDESRKVVAALIRLCKNIHSLNDNTVNGSELLTLFQKKYPNSYQAIWVETYPDYLISCNSQISPSHYLKLCLTILKFLHNNPQQFQLNYHDILDIINALFHQEQYQDYVLPRELQMDTAFYLLDMLLTFSENNIRHCLELLVKHQLFIPLKYFIYHFQFFHDKNKTRLLFNLAYQQGTELILFIIKLHNYFLDYQQTIMNKSLGETPYNPDYFLRIIEAYPEIVNDCYNYVCHGTRPFAKDIRNNYLMLIHNNVNGRHQNLIDLFLKISNFIEIIPSVDPVQGHYQKQATVIFQDPADCTINQKAPLFTYLYEKNSSSKEDLQNINRMNTIDNLITNKDYEKLRQYLAFELQLPKFNNEREYYGNLILRLLGSTTEWEQYLFQQQLRHHVFFIHLLPYVVNSTQFSLETITKSHPLNMLNVKQELKHTYVNQCLLEMLSNPNINLENKTYYLKRLLSSDFINFGAQHDDSGAINLVRSSNYWQTLLSNCYFADLDCFDIVTRRFSRVRQNHDLQFFAQKIRPQQTLSEHVPRQNP